MTTLSGVTAKGIRYDTTADDAGSIGTAMGAAAGDIDSLFDAMSTATRDALPDNKKWDGRRIFNLTSRRQEWWDDTNSKWRTFGGDPGLSLIFSVL